MASPESHPHGILHLPNSPHPHEGRRVSIAVISDSTPSKVNPAFEHDENGATNGHSPKQSSGDLKIYKIVHNLKVNYAESQPISASQANFSH